MDDKIFGWCFRNWKQALSFHSGIKVQPSNTTTLPKPDNLFPQSVKFIFPGIQRKRCELDDSYRNSASTLHTAWSLSESAASLSAVLRFRDTRFRWVAVMILQVQQPNRAMLSEISPTDIHHVQVPIVFPQGALRSASFKERPWMGRESFQAQLAYSIW